MDNLDSVDKEKIGLISDLKSCICIWKLAIQISILSHVEIDYLNLIPEYGGLRKKFFYYIVNISPVDPDYVFRKILLLSINDIKKLIDKYSADLSAIFKKVNKSIYLFVDRVDQAVEHYSKEVWVSVQSALIEASWDLMRLNHHIKIYSSIRQEAYRIYESPNKEAMAGEISFIRYSENDLIQMINKLAKYYEGKASFKAFIGCDYFINDFAELKEDSFRYFLRHTIGRPRDLVFICSKLSSEIGQELYQNKSDERRTDIKKTINKCGSEVISNIIYEVKVLVNTLKDEQKRNKLFSYINTNILTLSELRNICRLFNEIGRCVENCSECQYFHPFCELYSIGLLGVIRKDNISKTYKQKFIKPEELNDFSRGLPLDSPYYLIHPSMESVIENCNKNGYQLMDCVVVGNGYSWDSSYDKVIKCDKVIQKISDSDIKMNLKLYVRHKHFKREREAAEIFDGLRNNKYVIDLQCVLDELYNIWNYSKAIF